MAGKGDKLRPRDDKHCTRKQYEDNWDKLFKKK